MIIDIEDKVEEITPLTVDKYLDKVNYKEMNTGNYTPSVFALKFVNFIKLVNGDEGEENTTPVMHYKMLDNIQGKKSKTINLCFRGSSKTTLMGEYLILYIAVFGSIPGFGKLDGILYISDTIENGVKTLRQSLEARYWRSDFLQSWLPKIKFTENYIEFCNKENIRTGLKMFGAKSGLRGTKIFSKRPTLAILDDLVSDEDSNSEAAMKKISDTIYSGLINALHPKKNKIIWNGTPFNKMDVLYQAVESGGWDVNVYPVCEVFPCKKEDFNGGWEDRFSYEKIKELYNFFKKNKKLNSFNQELMLRISSKEERLIQDEEIQWYLRKSLLQAKHNFNFYITTDFATSSKQSADNNVISVWAVNNLEQFFWVDGIVKKQSMDKTLDDLFTLVQKYLPQSVGLEISGQQGAFISWIQEKMMSKNVYFNIAKEKGTNHFGIRPTSDKLSRFNMAVPLFTHGKIFFPKELEDTERMNQFMSEITLATQHGLKGKDDCLDTISMLNYINIIAPSINSSLSIEHTENVYSFSRIRKDEEGGYSTYLIN